MLPEKNGCETCAVRRAENNAGRSKTEKGKNNRMISWLVFEKGQRDLPEKPV